MHFPRLRIKLLSGRHSEQFERFEQAIQLSGH
jgi:hypothetical protein